jgi:hypothetical protein
LNQEELKGAGVFWLTPDRGANVFITRLHVRYNSKTFPQDLRFQETGDTESFQGRYVIRHPYKGEINCDRAQEYLRSVKERQEKEAQTLANLTGWDINNIRSKVNFVKSESVPWWRKLWQ